jgi:hypothetical protein
MSLTRSTEIKRVVEELEQLGSRVETTEFSNGTTSVDFGLFKRHPIEKLAERGQSASLDELRDSEFVTEDVKGWLDEVGETLEEEGCDLPTFLETGDADVATQRSGGRYRSSYILDSQGTVVEYNLRLPPVCADTYSKPAVVNRLIRICQNQLSTYSDPDAFNPEVLVRRYAPDAARENVASISDQYGLTDLSPPGETWCPHIRSKACSLPATDLLDFTEAVIKTYERRFSDHREWATPDAEQPDSDTAQTFDHLSSVVTDLQRRDVDGETVLTFFLPEADVRSRIRSNNGIVQNYRLALKPYNADEYGKILLRKALEQVTSEHSVLTRSKCRIESEDGDWVPFLECSTCSSSVDDIGTGVRTLAEEQDSICEFSRLR